MAPPASRDSPPRPHPDGERDPAPGERLARLERRLRLLLVHLTGPSVQARVEIDDLVQEVYLRALSSRSLPPETPGEAELWRFLTRIARNTVIDAARAIRAAKRSGATRLVHSDWSVAGPRASQILADTCGPASRAAVNELARRLETRFRSLSAEHRRVIGLRQFEGLSARESARRMGRSETAIHSLYRRALAAWQADDTILVDFRDESAPPERS
jgi:RNA polymerase sigma-70 factor (ECF subfamily)